jgi:hypothetical protein
MNKSIKKAIKALHAAGFTDARHLKQEGSDFVVSDSMTYNEATDALYDAGCEDFEFETSQRIEFYS